MSRLVTWFVDRRKRARRAKAIAAWHIAVPTWLCTRFGLFKEVIRMELARGVDSTDFRLFLFGYITGAIDCAAQNFYPEGDPDADPGALFSSLIWESVEELRPLFPESEFLAERSDFERLESEQAFSMGQSAGWQDFAAFLTRTPGSMGKRLAEYMLPYLQRMSEAVSRMDAQSEEGQPLRLCPNCHEPVEATQRRCPKCNQRVIF